MKKHLFLFLFAIMASIETIFAAAPTVNDLAAMYNVTKNVVFCIQFIEDAEVCNDVRFVGTPNNWGKGTTEVEGWDNCEKFAPIAGFDGWYAAELPYSEDFQGKPLQEPSNRAWTWDYQCGDMDAWVHVGGGELTLSNGFVDECNIAFGAAGAYIYQLKYWKNHKSPCLPGVKHTYTVKVYAPDACADMKPAIIGDFNGWEEGVAMKEGLDDDFETVYSYTFEDQEGHGFRIKEASDTDGSNEMQYYRDSKWENIGNITLGETEIIVLDYSEYKKYRYALCPDGDKIKIGDLYYNLYAADKTAEVTSGNYIGLTTANIPESVKYSGITYSVTSIGKEAFSGCSSLTSVTIPTSVTSIGMGAFVGCTSLNIIKVESPTPAHIWWGDISPWGSIFPDYENLYFYVPCGSVDAYIQAWGREYHGDYWGNDQLVREHFLYAPLEYTIECSANDPDLGEVTFPHTTCDDMILTATPMPNCHFVKWSDGNTDNPRSIQLTQDITVEAIFAKNPIITYKADLGYIEGPTTTPTGKAEDDITFTAYPNRGCYFVKWADGSTRNPRTYHLSQDVTMEAIFDYTPSGNSGKDNALTWKLDKATMALEITGKGELSDNFNYTYDIESVTIGNEITSIGQYAFANCSKLKNIIIGSSVKVIEEHAFDDCYAIMAITSYSQRPPTVNNGAFENLGYGTAIYVPADYLNTYKMHDFWGIFDVRPIGASKTETTEVKVEPTATTADVAWPAVENAATYELVIKDKNGNVVCTLIFNANGQLTQIAFNAPARDKAEQTAGFAFTVTGLEEGTSYNLTITAKDGNGSTLDEKTMAFTTAGGTGVEDTQTDGLRSTKVLRDGKIYILRGEKTYTVQGQEVK